VETSSVGKRLDQFLAEAIGTSRAQTQKFIKTDRVHFMPCKIEANTDIPSLCSTTSLSPSYHVRLGDLFAFDQHALTTTEETLTPYPMALEILFEDADIIVLNKPAGLVVHPGAGTREPALVQGLLAYTKGQLSNCGDPIRPGIVHRLDKDTSGVMVVAKTNTAHQRLAQQFAVHTLLRQYTAFCWGKLSPLSGEMITQIGRHPVNRQKRIVLPAGGKRAHTVYCTQQVFMHPIASEIQCELKTGRTHQVRVHLSNARCPVIGDPLYTRKRSVGITKNPILQDIFAFPRQALHATTLGFTHPTTNQEVLFTSPLPADLLHLKACLEMLACA
jgi:23S rRNA pseudouridine1911/1915/1917 synthase